MRTSKLLAAVLAVAPAAALAAPTTWTVDPAHSSAGFAVRHLVISTVRGQFTKVAGTVVVDDADPSRSRVEATLDAASVDTRVAARDEHLRSPDFLDVARYPTIAFRSTQVTQSAPGVLQVTGDLTLHGVTRPVTLAVTASPEVKGMGGEARRGYTATGAISRKAFGLTWNKVLEAGPAVADEVQLTLDVEAVKAAPAQAAR